MTSALESDILNMENDLSEFIQSQRRSIMKDKMDLERKSPRLKSPSPGRSTVKISQASEDGSSKNNFTTRENQMNALQAAEGFSLNLGKYESKQQKLRKERQQEYKKFLAEQQMRTHGRTTTCLSDDDRSPVAQRNDQLKDLRSDVEREYEELLKKKKKEEKAYRVQFDEPVVEVKSSKKIIEFDSDDEALFEFVKRTQKNKRRNSAEASGKRTEISEFKNAATFEGRAYSVPPAVPAIFGGSSQSSLLREKNKQYKKDLEDQIKEKELLKAKDKLKRLGRITSDVDISEIEIPPRLKEKRVLPIKKMENITPENPDQFHEDSYRTREHTSTNNSTLNPYTMYMNQNGIVPQNPMFNPMMANMPPGWNNYSMMANLGFNNNNMMGFPQTDMYKKNLFQSDGHQQQDFPVENKRVESRAQVDTSQYEKDDRHSRDHTEKVFPKRPNVQPPGGKSGGIFVESAGKDGVVSKRAQQMAYQKELRKQMEEKKNQDEKNKAERERYEQKLEAEIATYDPWGKGGGGAPMRNQDGKVVADLRKARTRSDESGEDKYQYQQGHDEPSPLMKAFVETQGNFEPPPNIQTPLNNSGTKSPKQDVSPSSYTRGAALKELQGINSLSPRDMSNQVEYKNYLQQQVEEKRKKAEELKEKARIEEEKENQRLADQQKRMKEEFEREKEKQRQKEEDMRKQNEELRQLAEQKRYQEECKRKEIEEDYQQDLKKQAEIRLAQKDDASIEQQVQAVRTNSPPVPAVNKDKKRRSKDSARREKPTSGRSSSKRDQEMNMDYLEKIRTSIECKNQADHAQFDQQQHLIRQLSALRQQLQKQEVKVHTELKRNKDKYSELLANKQEKSRSKPQTKDVFEKLVIKSAGRQRSEGKKDQREVFDGYSLDHDDRNAFDAQQQEYMRQQELRLKALRQNVEEKNFSSQGRAASQSTGSKQSLLDSDSKFLSMTSNHEFTNQYNEPRKMSARSRRREKDIFEDFFAADTSNRIEDIARRNEERLKKFEQMQENESDDEDADDIVRNFIRKVEYPSGSEQSLKTDTYYTKIK